mgnify:CR=1 FL=1
MKKSVSLLMILVMLGTQNNSFHRLLEEIEKCIEEKIINEEVIVQAGGTAFKSSKMEVFGMVSTEKLNEYIDKAKNYIIYFSDNVNDNLITNNNNLKEKWTRIQKDENDLLIIDIN